MNQLYKRYDAYVKFLYSNVMNTGFPVDLELYAKQSVDSASTHSKFDGSYLIRLGVAEMSNEWSFPFDDDSDFYVVKTTVNLYHELHHVRQFFEDSGTKPDVLRLLNQIVYNGSNNPVLYLQSYRHNFREIEAEYNGIANARDTLFHTFPDKTDYIDHLLAEYVLDKFDMRQRSNVLSSAKPVYFIEKPELADASGREYSDSELVDHALCALETAYDQVKGLSHGYTGLRYDCNDDILRVLDIKRQVTFPWKPFASKCLYSSGLAQDKYMAALECFVRPELQQQYPVLSSLTLESVYGEAAPEHFMIVRKRVVHAEHRREKGEWYLTKQKCNYGELAANRFGDLESKLSESEYGLE